MAIIFINTGEYAEIVVDFGGRVEELVLLSPFSDGQSHSYRKRSGTLHKILLSHNGNATAIKQNAWWKGMFLVPWANRIAYVSTECSDSLVYIYVKMPLDAHGTVRPFIHLSDLETTDLADESSYVHF